jgi:3-deoxy-7-phosphoheptulonate synthase
MIVQLKNEISEEYKQNIIDNIRQLGYKTSEVSTQFREYVIGVGKKEYDIRRIGNLAGVADIHKVTDSYKLVSKKWRVKDTDIDLGDAIHVNRESLAIMAGPCSIENEKQVETIADHLVKNNVSIMRGGVYKPRSSPYSFRGEGIEGLKYFATICHDKGLKIISEVMQVSQVEAMYDYIDIFQVGTRNSQNFNLLDALGEIDKPVLIKRGMSGTLDELLHSAEYVFSNGNEKIMLCERGIRTHENAYRNTLDINAVPVLKEKTHLPVIVDPSHGIGIRRFVEPVSLAAVMAGVDGLITEVHFTPERAASDGFQNLNFEEAERYYENVRRAYELREKIRF